MLLTVFLLSVSVTLCSSQLPIRTTPLTQSTRRSPNWTPYLSLNGTREDDRTPEMTFATGGQTVSPGDPVYTTDSQAYQRMTAQMNPNDNDHSNNNPPTNSYNRYGLALNPVQSDLLDLGVKADGEAAYNIHQIPTIDGQPVLVEVSVSLRNILEIDEHKQLITLETTLRLYWRDPRLQVEHLLGNKSSDYVLLHPDTSKFIWFPDVYIDFAKALRIPTLIIRPASLRIYRNSTCRYATQINYDVACPMNFEKYPYDTQVCKVKYESYGHTIEKMRVVWKKGFDQSKVTENNYISLAQFEYAVFFEENYEEEIASGVYPGVIMTVLLRRKISYHLLQTYLPSGLFVIVAWLSLFLPPESIPGRVTMAMTTLLTLAAMFGAVRQSTPKVSYVSALDIWMCTCIIFVFFALLEYVVVLCLLNKCQIGGLTHREANGWLSRRGSVNSCRQGRHVPPMGPGLSPGHSSPSDPQPRQRQHRHSCSSSIQENNGIRIALDGSTNSPRNFAHVGTDPPSKQMKYQEVKKRRNMFLCCSKKARKSSLRLQKYDIEVTRHARNRRSNFSEGSSFSANCCGSSHRKMIQRVEKFCSCFMALSFFLFNSVYWPWLLGDPDFDSAKYTFYSQYTSY